jgi:formate hydrogenlyase subunit 3/multisubunit Na+/H+ antiporter MnhD subunit
MKIILGLVIALFGLVIFQIGLSEENWAIYAIGIASCLAGVGIVVVSATIRRRSRSQTRRVHK